MLVNQHLRWFSWLHISATCISSVNRVRRKGCRWYRDHIGAMLKTCNIFPRQLEKLDGDRSIWRRVLIEVVQAAEAKLIQLAVEPRRISNLPNISYAVLLGLFRCPTYGKVFPYWPNQPDEHPSTIRGIGQLRLITTMTTDCFVDLSTFNSVRQTLSSILEILLASNEWITIHLDTQRLATLPPVKNPIC